MSRFVWEPPERLYVGGPELRPRTAADLLDDLGVSEESPQVQREAVNAWLVRHSDEVDDLMRISLERSGFRSRSVQVDAWAGGHYSALRGAGTVLIGGYFPHEMSVSHVPDVLLELVVSHVAPASSTFVVRRPGGTIFETNEPPDVTRVE
jgi:hypothetical protein